MRARETLRASILLLALLALVVGAAPLRASANPVRAAAGANGQIILAVTGTLGSVTASPYAISPAFTTSTSDYAIWCTSGINDLMFTLVAATGTLTYGSTTDSRVNVSVPTGENQAVVIEMNGQAESAGYWIRCLPHDFPRIAINKPGNPTAGYYLTGNLTSSSSGPPTSSYAMVLNQNGTPVWYQKAANGAIDVTLLANQTIAWAPNLGPGIGATPGGGYFTYSLSTQSSGKIIPPIPPGFTQAPADPHELQQLPNGNYVMIETPLVSGVDLSSLPVASLRSYNTIVDCVVVEFTPQGGLVWSWDAYHTGHILPDESQDAELATYNGTPAVDMYHCNSVDVSPQGTNVLVSSRHMSALFDFSPTSGQVLWKFGGNNAVPAGANQIVPTGDPEGTFSGQHDARMLNPSNDVATELSLYDDHSFAPSGGARGVVYSIDVAAGTSAYSTEYPNGGDTTAAGATGSFRVLDGGADNLVGWGFRAQGSGFTEYDGNGNVLMDQSFPNGEGNFRALKVPVSELDLNLLRASAGLPEGNPPNPTWNPVPNGTLTSGPALTSWSQTRYDIFGRGTDQEMWHIWWAGSGWSGWEPLGGVLTNGPAAASWTAGHLDVVVPGVGGAIWHKWFEGQWSGWDSLGGATSSSPGIAAWGPGRLDVFVDGTDGQLNHDWYQSGWASWEALGGGLTVGPSAASIASGELDIVAPSAGGLLERLQYTGGWQPWQPFANQQPTNYPPALVSLLNGANEEVCVTNSAGGPQCGSFAAITPPAQQTASGGSMSQAATKQLNG